jgi:hypothetical protein
MTDKSEKYEKLVKRIYELLSPDNKVVHNDKILGKDSQTLRQVDVSIRGKVGEHEILVAVECKDTKRKVDVHEIDAFCTKLKDIGANKGVLVSNAGFSSSARRSAERNGIELCSVHDAEEKDWRLQLKFPVIWEEIEPHIECKLHMAFDPPVVLGKNLDANSIFEIGDVNWFPKFKDDWEAGRIPLDKDNYIYDPLIPNPSVRLKDGGVAPLKEFKIEMNFKRNYYLGFFDQLPTAKAILNETTGTIHKLIFSADVEWFDKRKLIYLPTTQTLAIDPKTHIKLLLRPQINDWRLKAFTATGPNFNLRREMRVPLTPPEL